jgi:hypothetical protein
MRASRAERDMHHAAAAMLAFEFRAGKRPGAARAGSKRQDRAEAN